MKLCTECRHYRFVGYGNYYGGGAQLCGHPNLADPVDGSATSARDARKYSTLRWTEAGCGPDAWLWEAKPPKQPSFLDWVGEWIMLRWNG